MGKPLPLKTRGGCVKCKQRRVKCGEEKPQCRNCERLGIRGPCKFDASFKAPKGRVVHPKPLETLENKTRSIDWGSKEHNYYTQHDMELIHHFTNHTCKTCARSGILEVWQTVIPTLAYDHPCLMHGVIAIAALHQAALNSDRAAALLAKAMASMQVGLPYWREHLAELGPEHIHRGMAYAVLVGLYSFACPAVRNRGSIMSNPLGPYLEASTLLTGIRYVIQQNNKALSSGPFAPVFKGQSEQISAADEEKFHKYADLAQRCESLRRTDDSGSYLLLEVTDGSSLKETILNRLAVLDRLIWEYVQQYELGSNTCYHEALLYLSRLAERLLPDTPIKETDMDDVGKEPETLHFSWPVATRGEFTRLLREGDIPATTVVAHWALFCGQNSWFMQGWRNSLLAYAERTVKVEPWRRQVKWLCDLTRKYPVDVDDR